MARDYKLSRQEFLRRLADQFLRNAGGPADARKLLSDAIKRYEDAKPKRSRGAQPKPEADVYALAAAIQRQEGWKKRRSLLAAMKLKGIPEEELRRIEDRIRGKRLADLGAVSFIGIVGRVPV
jgi:hypothetical protein